MGSGPMKHIFTIFGTRICLAPAGQFVYSGLFYYSKSKQRNIRIVAFNKFTNWTARGC